MKNISWTFQNILEMNGGNIENASFMIETLLAKKRILNARAKNLDEYIPNCEDFSEDEFVFHKEQEENFTRKVIGFHHGPFR